MSAFSGVPVDAAYHVVSVLASTLAPLPGGLAAATAIVLFTMAVRLLLVPLSYRAQRGMDAQARLAATHHLLGAPLGSHLLAGAGPFSAQGAVFARLFLLLPGIGWLSARVARRSAGQPGQPTGALVRLTPYVTVAVAPFLPLAAGLYLATTTAWTLAERTILHRARVAD